MKFEKGTWTEWQPAAKKPDAETTVLVFSPKADEPCWLGYWDGEVWRDMENQPYATQVEMWAELPYPVERNPHMPAREKIEQMAEKFKALIAAIKARRESSTAVAAESAANKVEVACLP